MRENLPEKQSSKSQEKNQAINKVTAEQRKQLVDLNTEARQRLDTARKEKQRADQKGRSDTFRVGYFNKLAANASSPEEKARYAKLAERSKAIQSESRALGNDARRTEAAVVSKMNQMQKAMSTADAQRKMEAIKTYTNGQENKFQASIDRARVKSNTMRDAYLTPEQSKEMQNKEYAKLDKGTKEVIQNSAASVKQEGFKEVVKKVQNNAQSLETNTLAKESAISEFYGIKPTFTVAGKKYTVDSDFGQIVDEKGKLVNDKKILDKVNDEFAKNLDAAIQRRDEKHANWQNATKNLEFNMHGTETRFGFLTGEIGDEYKEWQNSMASLPDTIISKQQRERIQHLILKLGSPFLSPEGAKEIQGEIRKETSKLIRNASSHLSELYTAESEQEWHEVHKAGSQIAIDVLSSLVPVGHVVRGTKYLGGAALKGLGVSKNVLGEYVQHLIPASLRKVPGIQNQVTKVLLEGEKPSAQLRMQFKDTLLGAFLDKLGGTNAGKSMGKLLAESRNYAVNKGNKMVFDVKMRKAFIDDAVESAQTKVKDGVTKVTTATPERSDWALAQLKGKWGTLEDSMNAQLKTHPKVSAFKETFGAEADGFLKEFTNGFKEGLIQRTERAGMVSTEKSIVKQHEKALSKFIKNMMDESTAAKQVAQKLEKALVEKKPFRVIDRLTPLKKTSVESAEAVAKGADFDAAAREVLERSWNAPSATKNVAKEVVENNVPGKGRVIDRLRRPTAGNGDTLLQEVVESVDVEKSFRAIDRLTPLKKNPVESAQEIVKEAAKGAKLDAKAAREVLERSWNTPYMGKNVAKEMRQNWEVAFEKTIKSMKGSDEIVAFQKKFPGAKQYMKSFTDEFVLQQAKQVKSATTAVDVTAEAMQSRYAKALTSYLEKMNSPKMSVHAGTGMEQKAITHEIIKDILK